MPDWKPVREGDKIRHNVHDENKMRQRVFRSMSVSSHSSGIQTPNMVALNLETPFREYDVEITNLKANDDDTENSALYLCRFRFYDTSNEQWASRTEEYLLDALDVGSQLFVGARITARWDAMRGAFVPCHPSIIAAILTETLERCGTATAKVLNPFNDELQEITVTDFIDVLASDWRHELAVDTMIYVRPVGYAEVDTGGLTLSGQSTGSTVQYEIIVAGGNCSSPPESQVVIGQMDELIGSGETKTMRIYDDNPLTDTGETLEVSGLFLGAGETIAANEWVKATHYHGVYYIDTARCP